MADEKNKKDKDIAKIEPATLHEIHDKFNILLAEYGFEAKSVNIKIFVSNSQYEKSKNNFPESIHRDLAVLETGKDWVVELLRWPYLEEEEPNK